MGVWGIGSECCDDVQDYTKDGSASIEDALKEWDADAQFFPETSGRKASYLGIVMFYLKLGKSDIAEDALRRAFNYAQDILRDRHYLQTYNNHIARAQQIQKELILIRKEADK